MHDDTVTLTREDYTDQQVWESERRAIFHGGWVLAGSSLRLAPGNRTVVDIAGESVLLARDLQGTLRAFANVCRHRGSRLCEAEDLSSQGSVMCPYHAWTYALDGRLIATPHLDGDDVDKDSLPLWQYRAHEWQGMAFVSLAADPPSFDEWLTRHAPEVANLTRFGIGDLQVVATTRCDIAANWKIVIENYQECLHCTRVHPELVDLVPLYRSGWVTDHSREDGGVALARGTTMSATPVELPPLPGVSEVDRTSYFGGTWFPNGFVDITGPNVVISTLYPTGPAHTVMTMDFLFHPDAIATPGFDPQPIIDFNVLVGDQDNRVCELVQQGVSSLAFDRGLLTPKDELVKWFVAHYRAMMAG
ncbi:MAG: aromatic ring-hydroxylating oxygenase subunit alpha [Ilumatobacteraceae bacterium]